MRTPATTPHRTNRTLRMTAIGASVVSIAAGSIATASAAQAAPARTASCSWDYANPYNGAPARSTATVTALGEGAASVTVRSNTKSLIGYTQTVQVVWNNSDNPGNGLVGTEGTVRGSNAALRIPSIATGTGLVGFTFDSSNTSKFDANAVTYGGCFLRFDV